MDLVLPLVLIAILLLFAAGQYWLCRKTTRLALRLIPLYAGVGWLIWYLQNRKQRKKSFPFV